MADMTSILKRAGILTAQLENSCKNVEPSCDGCTEVGRMTTKKKLLIHPYQSKIQ